MDRHAKLPRQDPCLPLQCRLLLTCHATPLQGHGLPVRPGTVDGAISISAVQWLCNAVSCCALCSMGRLTHHWGRPCIDDGMSWDWQPACLHMWSRCSSVQPHPPCVRLQDTSKNDPRKRLRRFFESLYACLSKGARAVLQVGRTLAAGWLAGWLAG